mgnify:CR=1 FL=1|jgi:hypothetical protein
MYYITAKLIAAINYLIEEEPGKISCRFLNNILCKLGENNFEIVKIYPL